MFRFEKEVRFFEVRFEYPNFIKSHLEFNFYVPITYEGSLKESEKLFNEQEYDTLLQAFLFELDCMHILKNELKVFFGNETEDTIPITDKQRMALNNLAISEGDYDIVLYSEGEHDCSTYYAIDYVDINIFKKILKILENKND